MGRQLALVPVAGPSQAPRVTGPSRSARALYECTGCATEGRRAFYARGYTVSPTAQGDAWQAPGEAAQVRGFAGPPPIPCPGCLATLEGREVIGEVGSCKRCDSSCRFARRNICECSCGGANHGSGWGG